MRSRIVAMGVGMVAAASGALAQDQSDRSEAAALAEIVVTGTRVQDRSRLDTLAPVDVLSNEALTSQGTTELAEALSNVAPSLNFPRPSITDGTDHIRPATLRGLAPDQTLVLVNSKRRHQSALVNVNNSVGRGSAAVDLNAIPLAAIERVEVLRDGASAQYGSDAIAGVLNVRLREASDGGAVSVTVGEYDTDVDTARGSRDESDGQTITGSVWAGLPLGGDGFLTLTGEYRDRDPTSRGDFDPRIPPTRVTSRFGDSNIEDLTFYANAGISLQNDWRLYGWAGFQQREGDSAAFFRNATDARNVPAIYPNGFLPLITSEIDDLTAAWGARGALGAWDADVSIVYGRNDFDYGVTNSLNASFGASSQTTFDAGAMEYDQIVFNFGLVRGFDWGLAAPVNVATGIEARRESYAIEAGEPASYLRGPVTTAAAGSQGFPGFQPSNELDEDREAYGIYADLEAQLTEQFLGSVAVRGEEYSDFGSNVSGKLSARYDFTQSFALRGTVSTGFRAPGLQQQFFTSTATNFIGGVPFEVGTFPATAPISRALGASELEAEESRNYSIGAVFRAGSFEATIDAYRIDIDDRIVLSENLGGDTPVGGPTGPIDRIIQPFGIARARFFINGVDTETEGVDFVLRYRLQTAQRGRFNFTATGNVNDTKITRLPTTTVLAPLGTILFGRFNRLSFEEGTPSDKFTLATDWEYRTGFGSLGVNVQATRYGDALEPSTNLIAPSATVPDIPIEAETLVDLKLLATFGDGFTAALGADNLLDEYPDPVPAIANPQAALGFSRYSPFGFNGRFLYAQLSYDW